MALTNMVPGVISRITEARLCSTVCEPGHHDTIGQRKRSLQEELQDDNGTRSTDLPAMTVGSFGNHCVVKEPLMAGTFPEFIGCGFGPLPTSIYRGTFPYPQHTCVHKHTHMCMWFLAFKPPHQIEIPENP